jgi:hypothetical protein
MLVVDLSVRHEILGDLNAANLNAKTTDMAVKGLRNHSFNCALS